MQRFSSFLGRKRVRAFLTAATALGLASTLVTGEPAQADPKQFEAATGVGSDTTQDIMDALAGFSNNVNYPPIQSSAASGRRQITSFTAVRPGHPTAECITPKAPGATVDRPNGSSAGRRALSRAIDGTPFGTAAACANKSVTGLFQWARSSAGPAPGTTCDPGVTTCLTYIPFGRDAISFAYYARGTALGNETTNLTPTQLKTIFSTPGPHNFGGPDIYGCSIQTSSGQYQSWRDMVGVTDAQMEAATQVCTPTTNDLQEGDGNALKARADSTPALANAQVIIGYSAGNFIAQTNGTGPDQLPDPAGTVKLGSINGNLPVTGTLWAGPLSPNSAFFNDGVFGRNVYNVLASNIALGAGNNDMKSLFVGASSAVCNASATISSFGFGTPVGGCGTTTLHGPLFSGAGG